MSRNQVRTWFKNSLALPACYCIAQILMVEKLTKIEPLQNFDKKNSDELIVGYLADTLKEKD